MVPEGMQARAFLALPKSCYQEPLIPAVDSVFIKIVAGFSASFCVEFDWKRDKNWLNVWLALLVGMPVEPLLALESPAESAEAART